MYVITHTQSLLPYIEKIRPKDKILSIFTPDRHCYTEHLSHITGLRIKLLPKYVTKLTQRVFSSFFVSIHLSGVSDFL